MYLNKVVPELVVFEEFLDEKDPSYEKEDGLGGQDAGRVPHQTHGLSPLVSRLP